MKCLLGGYEAGQGVCDTTFDWKSLGQELRPDDLTTDLIPFKHGNRALASKDMRKSQGKWCSKCMQKHTFNAGSKELAYKNKLALCSDWVCLSHSLTVGKR